MHIHINFPTHEAQLLSLCYGWSQMGFYFSIVMISSQLLWCWVSVYISQVHDCRFLQKNWAFLFFKWISFFTLLIKHWLIDTHLLQNKSLICILLVSPSHLWTRFTIKVENDVEISKWTFADNFLSQIVKFSSTASCNNLPFSHSDWLMESLGVFYCCYI